MCRNNDNVVKFLEDLISEMERRSICGWRIVEIAEYEEVIIAEKVYAKVSEELYEKHFDIYIDDKIFEGIILKPITDELAVVIDYIV